MRLSLAANGIGPVTIELVEIVHGEAPGRQSCTGKAIWSSLNVTVAKVLRPHHQQRETEAQVIEDPFVLPRLKVLATTAAYAAEIAAWPIPVSHR
jgi:hypothetical protein